MNNFVYQNPTRLVFGKGTIAQLKDLIAPSERIMMTYGGGSIRKNGVYDQVKAALGGRGQTMVEFGGIQPNPLYETLMEAVKLARAERITFLLAVGGGSVLDGTKFIAAAIGYQGADPWNMANGTEPVKGALPVGSVLTLPATGSESNTFAVISRKSTGEKFGFGSEHMYPRFAILDPAVTASLPEKQVRNGIVDAFVHVMEQYITYPVNAALQDRQAEAILQTLIEEGPKALHCATDYGARANLVWSATQALNGLIGCGVPQDWATHMIGHELTAFYGVDHAESLAVVMPALFRDQFARKQAKLAQFGRRIWQITGSDPARTAEAAIARMEGFFHSLGMPTKLADYRIDPKDAARKIGGRFRARGTRLGEHGDIDAAVTERVLLAC